jgi:subtilisin family serine protease
MIRVGLVDSGVAPDHERHVIAARSFTGLPLVPDRHGHGTALARIILAHHPKAVLLNAQTFDTAPASAEAVAEAIHWLTLERARIVNLSLGLRHDRAVLRSAVETALNAGLILVGSVPARGPVPYPASYSGVIRVTGDARCRMGQLSLLQATPAVYGATPRGLDGRLGGASFAVAHLTGLLSAGLAAASGDPHGALERLIAWRGPERRVTDRSST